MDQDAHDLAKLLDPRSWTETYYAVVNEPGELVGFFAFKRDGDVVDLGLGLRPDLTGRGIGLPFLLAALDFASSLSERRGRRCISQSAGQAMRPTGGHMAVPPPSFRRLVPVLRAVGRPSPAGGRT